MVPGTEGIGIWVEKYENTGLLIIFHEMPSNRRQDDADCKDIAQQGQFDIGYKEHAKGNRQKYETGPQVRLLQYEQEGNPYKQADREQALKGIQFVYFIG